MAITIEPYSTPHEPLVRDFNARLRAGGSELRFPAVSDSGEPEGRDDSASFREIFVALDGSGSVRGGYQFKHQPFMVAGQRRSVAEYTFPLSEGVIDRRYGLVGVSMILDAQKRKPLLYGLGMGGESQPSVRVMKAVGWSTVPIPFYFRVLRPYRFLRNIEYLRSGKPIRVALDLAAFSGLGWAALNVTCRMRRSGLPSTPAYEQITGFGNWADDVWEAGRDRRGLAAVRDRRCLPLIYPPQDARYIMLRVHGPRKTAGWVVCLATQMTGNPYFGDMHVGSIVDGMAMPGMVPLVIAAADRELARRGVDVIVSNQSHWRWCKALEAAGYLSGPSNYILSCSTPLTALLGSLQGVRPHCHINRGDGDGPIHL